jgi:steroid delta-isomerase-like uncharacterized protein
MANETDEINKSNLTNESGAPGAAAGRRSVRDLVEAVRAGKLTRRQLVVGLSALGLTAAGIAAIVAVATHPASATHTTQQHLQHHDQHIARQVQGDVPSMMSDYAEGAVVDDPLFAAAFVGRAAIATRYAAEVASVPDRALTVLHRTVSGDQLIVEWEATGTHSQPFLGIGGAGRPYRLHGVTVVTRRDGLIVRESHYYDTAHLRAQIDA